MRVGMPYTAVRPLLLCSALLTACPDDRCDGSDCVATTATTSTSEPTTTAPTGTSGDPTGTPPELMRCQPTCRADADCLVSGMAIGFACVAGVCGLPACVDDLACQHLFSGWSTPCLTSSECFSGQVCIEVAGEGRCATQPDANFACSDLGLVELMRPALVDDQPVIVCGNDDAACVDGVCRDPCARDSDCDPQNGHPHCELATGECTCASDVQCSATGIPGLVACLAGRCGCAGDDDCVGGINVDTCYAGECGCSATATCSEQSFDGAVLTCAPP